MSQSNSESCQSQSIVPRGPEYALNAASSGKLIEPETCPSMTQESSLFKLWIETISN